MTESPTTDAPDSCVQGLFGSSLTSATPVLKRKADAEGDPAFMEAMLAKLNAINESTETHKAVESARRKKHKSSKTQPQVSSPALLLTAMGLAVGG